MNKNLRFLFLCCCCLPFLTTHAISFVDVNSGTVVTDALVMDVDGTKSITYVLEEGETLNDSYARWVLLGDLALAEGSLATDSIITLRSTGYGKGCVRLRSDYCAYIAQHDVFKSFVPPADLEISGPACITQGDVVVFSIEPILTVNLSHNIGIDEYYWSVNDSPLPSFVDSLYYRAGDGSSVTFRAGAIGENDSISVILGKANRQDASKAIRLPLSKKAPLPDVVADTCVAYGQHTATFRVHHPVEGVTYTWEVPSQFTLSSRTGSSVDIGLDSNSAAEVRVIASYGDYVDDSDCGISISTIRVYRSFGTTAALSPSFSCTAVGNAITMKVGGAAPLNSSYEWLLPEGWESVGATQGQYLMIRPTASARLSDTVRVTLAPCYDDTLSCIVNVRPAAVPAASVIGESCLTIGTPTRFYVENLSALQPCPDTLVWSVPEHWRIIAGGSCDTVYVVADEATAQCWVGVRSVGYGSCNAEVTTKSLSFTPATPLAILGADTCIASNMPDTLTLEVENPVAGQTYAWLPVNNALEVDYLSDAERGITNYGIRIATNGVPTTQISTGVYATSINGSCGNSDTIYANMTIPEYVGAELKDMLAGPNLLLFTPPASYEPAKSHYYIWDLYIDGEYHSKLGEGTGTPYAGLPDPQIQEQAFTIVCTVIFTDGCKARFQHGTPLNSDQIIHRVAAPASSQLRTVAQPQLVLTPNPAQTFVNLRLDKGSATIADDVFILSAAGSLVAHYNSFDMSMPLDIASLPAGQYLVIIRVAGGQYSNQLIKQ